MIKNYTIHRCDSLQIGSSAGAIQSSLAFCDLFCFCIIKSYLYALTLSTEI